ncbi:MAG: DUF885 domain-containing protein [Planctomycetes bacterium]|nr:DUF885 domain-containing protein [Planctomycetota bacterium]
MDFARRCHEIVARPGVAPGERLAELLRATWAWEMEEFPERATWHGFPGQNHRFSDRSRAAIERRRGDLAAPLSAARALPRAELSAADQLNLDLFVRECEQSIEESRWPFELLCITQMDGVHQDPVQLLAAAPAATAKDRADLIARLAALPTLIDQSLELLREGLARGVTPPQMTLRDVPAQIAALLPSEPLESPLLAPIVDAAALADAQETGAAARGAGERLKREAAALLRERIAPRLRALHDFVEQRYLPGARTTTAWRDLPDGEAWYAFKVREQTTTRLTPREIHQIGLDEVARLRAALEATVRASGFAGDFAAFCDFLRTDPRFYCTSAEQLLSEYRDFCKRVDPQLVKLVKKLPRLPYGVCEVPAFSAESQTMAYYLPGSHEAGRPGWFYANTSKLESRPRWEMEALSLHEAVPGHHLQLALAAELDLPDFRRHGGCNAYVEGWALYSEALGYEMGFYQDAYSRFGQLSYEMWRAIRLVVDTGLHALGWTRQQALDYFAANTGKPLHDITVEVDRYIVWPAQALSYKLGELAIWKLRRAAQQQLGARFDLRDFHDELLGEGALPLDLLEQRMTAWTARQLR